MTYEVINGNNIEVLKTYPDNHFDSIVTDPPYGIDFLGKDWDANTGALETYQECLRVLKPGGHILAFSAARTYHHLAITLEQAGFEIRDQIMWIYSSGFPKSHDVGRQIQKKLGVKEKLVIKGGARPSDKMATPYAEDKQYTTPVLTDPEALKWEGWGNALKPAHEPICMARKPMKSSILQNVQEWGTGAINIDASRISYDDAEDLETYINNVKGPLERSKSNDGDSIKMFEGQTGFKSIKKQFDADTDLPAGRFPSNVLGEIEGYQKYFYCPKVSRSERHMGFDLTTIPTNPEGMLDHAYKQNDEFAGKNYQAVKNETLKTGNNHPTVKPVELMKYLVKLVTPKGGTVLDPFNGSGSTGMACVELGFNYVGIDLDNNYVDISMKRIEAHHKKHSISELFVIEH
jgi:DNA modification methylase